MVEPDKPTPREVYIAYLRMKVDEEDWHGVSDAACDLRELDARRGSIPQHKAREIPKGHEYFEGREEDGTPFSGCRKIKAQL